jgi:hypothetical protein
MEGEWGARWTRNIVWLVGRLFVVIDEVEATRAGAFAIQCNWRSLGTPKLEGGRLEAVQRDPDSGREDRFVLENAGDDRISLERDWISFGHWWKNYSYSDDYVNILSESANREMAEGDRHTFANLFYATNETKPVEARMRRVGESAVLIEGSEGTILVGSGGQDGTFSAGPISGKAQVYAVGEGWFALLAGTSLRGEQGIFESEAPVSIGLDIASGEGTTEAADAGQITLCGQERAVPEGEQGFSGVSSAGVSLDLDAVLQLQDWKAAPAGDARAPSAPALRSMQSHDLGSAVRCVAPRGDGIVVGTDDGRVVALEPDGKTAWTFRAEDAVLSVCAAGQDGDSEAPVAVGSNDRHLYLVDDGGAARWSHEFELFTGGWAWYTRNSSVELVKAADLRGTGQPDILAAVTDRQLHCFDADGTERWTYYIYGIFEPFCMADVNGDGLPEVIGGPGRISCGGTCYVLDADGKEIASNGLDGWPSMMPGCDVYLYPNGGHLIACGTTQSKVHALRLEENRLEPLWSYEVGEEVHAILAKDLDGSGKPAVVAGSDCFYAYLFGEDGTERWRRNLQAPVRRLLAVDVNQDGCPEIVAGCDDGSVWVLDGEGNTLGVHRTEAKLHGLASDGEGRLLLGSSDGKLTVLGL